MKKCWSYSSRFRLLFSIVLYSTVAWAQPGLPFPEGTKRIVFLGNSITYSGTYVADIESYFVANYPKLQYEFINVGLPSETVSGLSEPNHADATQLSQKPSVIPQMAFGLTKKAYKLR